MSSKNLIPIFDLKNVRQSRTSKSMFEAEMKKGFESDCSLESVDLDHNISEAEGNTEPNKCETETSINISNCDIIADTNNFLTNTTEEREHEFQRPVLASATDENCSINVSHSNQQCLSSRRTSLSVSLQNTQTQSSQCHQSSSTECHGLDLDYSSTHHNSVIDDLLFEIYDRYCYKDSLDSDTFTDLTESDAVLSKSEQGRADGEKVRLNVANLMGRDVGQLKQLVSELSHCSAQMSSRLIKQLKSRERHMTSLRDKYDIMTAILHASSLKRREDSKIRFSIEPMPGEDAFNQWKDAMKAIARLPRGIPEEFKKKVWLSLADNYLNGLCIDWEKTKKFAFNERSNPDDSKLGLQIVKDLHRTGCSGFSGRDNDEDRAVLKRVLLAYARWNKHVGYCQGFNILAALILEVVERQEDSALKVMIYLIDRVLPESYFANNLRSLSVDMAVFRHLLRTHLPELSKHLDSLQFIARDEAVGANYEPPLTNVFTMQWFLTVFATCLSKPMVLRVWDCILLEGSEILLRTAIVIWEKLQHRIMNIKSADEFYSVMRVLNQEMLDDKLLDTEDFIKRIFSIAPFPLQHLSELREKFTYNITPFTNMMNANRLTSSARTTLVTDEEDDDDLDDGIHCFSALFPGQHSMPRSKEDADLGSADISKLSPGAYTAHPELVHHFAGAPVLSERVTLDVDMLRRQYKNLMQRQKQAHIILSAVQNKKITNDPLKSQSTLLKGFSNQNSVDVVPPAINHLFASKELLLMTTKNKKNQTVLPVTKRLSSDMKSNKKSCIISEYKSLNKSSSKRPAFEKCRSFSVESSTSNAQSDEKSAGVELSSSLASSSSMSLGRDDRSLKSDVTCEPSQPWTESSPRDDDRSCETLHITLSEIHSPNDDDLSSVQITRVIDQKQTGDTKIDSADFEANENKENGQSKVEENMLFKEFIESLPDESGAASKSSRYNKLQCHVQNLKPIHHNLRIRRMSNSSTAIGTPTEFTNSPSHDQPLQLFNPFPRKSFNSSRTRFGVQLGLYLSQNYNKLGSSSVDDELHDNGPHSIAPLSKSYHNACLHRQFLVTSTKRPKQVVK